MLELIRLKQGRFAGFSKATIKFKFPDTQEKFTQKPIIKLSKYMPQQQRSLLIT